LRKPRPKEEPFYKLTINILVADRWGDDVNNLIDDLYEILRLDSTVIDFEGPGGGEPLTYEQALEEFPDCVNHEYDEGEEESQEESAWVCNQCGAEFRYQLERDKHELIHWKSEESET
jgi:hypothetical protein